jgi:DNA-binding CsgD family transcriptional regulator
LATPEPWSKVGLHPSGRRHIELLERQEHLKRLEKAFAAARGGGGRIVAIAGEAGVGKTALVERFVADLGVRARVHRGACENLSTPEALLPLRDIARAGGQPFDPQADNIRSFESLLAILSSPSLPSVLVIEDLHWADTVTLDLIRFVARRIRGVRALIVLTYRDEELDTGSPLRTLLGEAPADSVERMRLESLSPGAVTQLAEKVGRRGDVLFALTAGNPFLVTETLAVDCDVPTDAVRDATLARAARLSPEARVVLEAVSIFPRRADTAIVADLSKGAFGRGLDACVERGMLALDGAMLRFRHELARRAIEASIAPSRRRALHQAVVDELIGRPTARASEIAHHAERAADLAALLKFARRAGDEAARAGAPREAASHYRAILAHSSDAAVTVQVLECFAEQSYLMGAADTAMSAMLEASAHRRALGHLAELGRDLTRLSRFAWMCGRRLDAEGFVAEAIVVLEQIPPGVELAWAYSHRSQLEMLASQTDTAIHWGNRALALAGQLGDQEIVIHALANIGTAKADHDRSGSCPELERSFQLALAGGYHDHVERATCNLTCTHYIRRDYPSSLRYLERGVAYAAARELTHWEGYLRGWRAMIQVDRGDWTEAEDEIERILSRVYASDVYRFPALVALARLRLRRGDPDAATPLEEVRRLASSLAELQRSVYLGILLAERAWLSAPEDAGGGQGEAVASLRAIVAHAAASGAQWAVDDAALWLHTLGESGLDTAAMASPFREHCEGRWKAAAAGWAALGRPYEEALALSGGDDEAQRRALDLFDRLSAVPAAARLRRSLRARGVRAIPRGPIADTRANPAGLTRRQAQVLSLVEEGLSNTEIAARLCISAKTAEHHVSAIMARLGVASRREAAVAARALATPGAGRSRGQVPQR